MSKQKTVKKLPYTKDELILIGKWNIICMEYEYGLSVDDTENIPININEFMWLKKRGFV
jgi:hypothetical protein